MGPPNGLFEPQKRHLEGPNSNKSRVRSEGFWFLSGDLGDRVPSDIGNAFAHDRARSRYARCAVPLGLACMGAPGRGFLSLCRGVGIGGGRGCALRIGLYWGCLVGVGRRCAVVIGGEGMVWVSLCRCDWQESVVWGVALCDWDCVGSAVPL